jgi:drug/metabolite transporter (DMT)-like permease
MNNLFYFAVFIAYALSSGCGLILLKIAMSKNDSSLSTLRYVIFDLKFLVGFSLYVCGFLLWMYILSKFNLNVAFPIAMALFFIVSSLGSYYVLGEVFSLKHVIGTCLCFLGIILVGLK